MAQANGQDGPFTGVQKGGDAEQNKEGMVSRRRREMEAVQRALKGTGVGPGGGEDPNPAGGGQIGPNNGGDRLRGDMDPTRGKKYTIPRGVNESLSDYAKRIR